MNKQRYARARAPQPKPELRPAEAPPETDELSADYEPLAFDLNGVYQTRQNPQRATSASLLAMQHTVGNRAVQRVLAARKPAATAHSCNAACHHTLQRHPQDAASPGVIQRHASHEHKMLGDVEPGDLEVMAAGSNLKGNKAQTTTTTKDSNGKEVTTVKDLTIKGGKYDGAVITKEMVLHTLQQEINRIKFFRDNPPNLKTDTRASYTKKLQNLDRTSRQAQAKERTDAEAWEKKKQGVYDAINPMNYFGSKKTAQATVTPETDQQKFVKEQESQEWQVKLVSIPSDSGGDPLIVTYGEMNTLADIYGSVDELRKVDSKDRWEIVQGIRQLSLFNLIEMYNEYADSLSLSKLNNSLHMGEGFDGASGNTGRGGGTMGEVRFLMGGKKKNAANPELNYDAGLGRNACHFAPESWYSWADSHKKAKDLAVAAFQINQLIKQKSASNTSTKEELEGLQAQSDNIENEALLQNGFGDHFLQDSFAAGHLINKTQIMKWFVQYMDNHPFKADYTTDTNWRKNQAMAYGQNNIGLEADRYDTTKVGQQQAKDPQSVENMQGNWQGRFQALGLKIPSSVNPDMNNPIFRFTIWWQKYAVDHDSDNMTYQTAVDAGFGGDQVKTALRQLIADGVARLNWSGTSREVPSDKQIEDRSFVLRDVYVPHDKQKFTTLYNSIHNIDPETQQSVVQDNSAALAEYKETAEKVTYGDFHEFLNNSLMQAGTNVLHNKFCNEGLEVYADNGTPLGRIYGDYKMLAQNSSFGVKYSAETARLSRNAIYETFEHGQPGPDKQIDIIAARFPNKVKYKGKDMSLADWQLELKKVCDDEVFAEAQSGLAGTVGGVKGNNLAEKISKDVDVHSGELF